MLEILTVLAICQNSVTSDFVTQLESAAIEYNVRPELLLAVVAVESNCDNSRSSITNNIGYGQIGAVWEPKAIELGYDITQPQDNLLMTAYILDSLKSYSWRERLRRYHGYRNSKLKANRYADRVLAKQRLTCQKRL